MGIFNFIMHFLEEFLCEKQPVSNLFLIHFLSLADCVKQKDK